MTFKIRRREGTECLRVIPQILADAGQVINGALCGSVLRRFASTPCIDNDINIFTASFPALIAGIK
jgi:hypothetical protein